MILLAPDSDDPDSEVIKTLLALTHNGEEGPRIVAEIQDPSNLEAAALVGKGRTTLLDIRETVAKLVVQTSRQSGAAAVYTELFDYSGDEFYFFEDHGLAGSTYAEAQLAFEAASVVGVLDGGMSKLNPPPDTVITAEQTLIVVVEDDSALEGQSRSLTEPALNRLGEQTGVEARPTQALLIGWNDRAPIVVRELDRYAPPGLDADRAHDVRRARAAGVQEPRGDRGEGVLDQPGGARAARRRRPRPDHRALLRPGPRRADRRLADPGHACCTSATSCAGSAPRRRWSARCSTTATGCSPRSPTSTTSWSAARSSACVVTQLSEDGRLEAVFKELLGAEGSEIYLRPAEWYVQPGEDVSWATVVAGAARRNETAIGLKSALLAEPGLKFGVVVNPPKSQTYTIGAGDAVVVLAED